MLTELISHRQAIGSARQHQTGPHLSRDGLAGWDADRGVSDAGLNICCRHRCTWLGEYRGSDLEQVLEAEGHSEAVEAQELQTATGSV